MSEKKSFYDIPGIDPETFQGIPNVSMGQLDEKTNDFSDAVTENVTTNVFLNTSKRKKEVGTDD